MSAHLTLKSSMGHLNQLVGEGRLVPIPPALPGARQVRTMYAAADLAKQILEPDSFWTLAYPNAILRADLDHFLTGGLMPFAVGRERTCRIKVLNPWEDEVWELRSRGVKPGARILGRFAHPDVFVGLCIADRDTMDFSIEIRRCKAEWRKLFATHQPFSGTKPDDYISKGLVDLRDS